jgi:hypothetical protein
MTKTIPIQLAIQGGGARITHLLAALEAVQMLQREGVLRETLTRARRAATKSGDTAALSTILLRQGDLYANRGDLAAAERFFAESESIARELPDDPTLVLVDAYRAKMLLAGRRWREASELAAKSADAAEALGQPETLVPPPPPRAPLIAASAIPPRHGASASGPSKPSSINAARSRADSTPDCASSSAS